MSTTSSEPAVVESMQTQRLDGCRMLTATPDAVSEALDVAAAMGISQAVVVYGEGQEPERISDPWEQVGMELTALGRIPVTVVRFDRPAASSP